jgi:hypothetical protein
VGPGFEAERAGQRGATRPTASACGHHAAGVLCHVSQRCARAGGRRRSCWAGPWSRTGERERLRAHTPRESLAAWASGPKGRRRPV